MALFKEQLNFSGKTVVVTGGLGQFGFHISRAFLEYGATVLVADVVEKRFEELQKESGGTRAVYVDFDIATPESIPNAITNLIDAHPRIGVWVNTAYPRTADWGARLEDVVFASWDENMRTHLGGYFWTSKTILEHMKERGGGALINFGSIYGVVGPNFSVYEGTTMTMPVAYAAIKGAINNLTRYLATYYGPHNVRVNSICPGGLLTAVDSAFVERYEALTPLKRMARAEEMSMPTLFLASDAASYITGHTLMVDGGWTAW